LSKLVLNGSAVAHRCHRPPPGRDWNRRTTRTQRNHSTASRLLGGTNHHALCPRTSPRSWWRLPLAVATQRTSRSRCTLRWFWSGSNATPSDAALAGNLGHALTGV